MWAIPACRNMLVTSGRNAPTKSIFPARKAGNRAGLGVSHQESFEQMRWQRNFVQKYRDVRADEQNIDDREAPVRVKIFEWNKHEEPRSE